MLSVGEGLLPISCSPAAGSLYNKLASKPKKKCRKGLRMESDSGEAIKIATIKLNVLHQRGVPLNGLIYLLQKRMILGIFVFVDNI